MVIQRLGMRPMKDAYARPIAIMRRDRPRIELITRRSLQLQMIYGRGPVTHSCSALSRDQHVDQSMLFCGVSLFESVCACMCVDCIDVCFESDRLPAKKDFTR